MMTEQRPRTQPPVEAAQKQRLPVGVRDMKGAKIKEPRSLEDRRLLLTSRRALKGTGVAPPPVKIERTRGIRAQGPLMSPNLGGRTLNAVHGVMISLAPQREGVLIRRQREQAMVLALLGQRGGGGPGQSPELASLIEVRGPDRGADQGPGRGRGRPLPGRPKGTLSTGSPRSLYLSAGTAKETGTTSGIVYSSGP